MDFLFFGLLFLAILFGPALAAWISARRTRADLDALMRTVEHQQRAIDLLIARVGSADVPSASARQAPPASARRPATAEPAPTPAVPSRPSGVAPPPPPSPLPPTPGAVRPPAPVAVPPPAPVIRPAAASADVPSAPAGQAAPPPLPPPPRPPRPPRQRPEFDWESLIGVKLFSAIAGIALVIAAVFFLRYSVEHGWLQPPVRVVIGIVVSIVLLVLCELKAARRYPVTANALDAAAIAILFSTFFAAHALWNLIPSLVAFVLLAMVTAIAVLLSIRRESLFIAVLGLLGGFATPALLSTGENRPIPLFSYLMLLNIGLAWVAYRKRWPLLSILTVALTTVYQWGWVFKFLDASSLTLAMTVFVAFPLVAIAGLLISRQRVQRHAGDPVGKIFERSAIMSAALPLVFAMYVSSVPAYGARPWLLFGFMLLLDAGLFAVAVVQRRALLHAAAGVTTLTVAASWLVFLYAPGKWVPPLVFCATFVVFFTAAPVAAARLRRPLDETGADFVAPLLLFVPVVLARIEPAFGAPFPLFATLVALILVIAWRAIAFGKGALYFVAAFFAVAAQASWSITHLRLELLRSAVIIYAAFGIVSAAIPVLARRRGRPLEPASGSGIVLLASLALLLFLSSGSIAPAALWALALLLAILNAALFIESASSDLPRLSVIGSGASWLVLAAWWMRAGAAVGLLASLAVLMGLTLITLAGHAWMSRRTAPVANPHTVDGMYLGLGGHLFLLFITLNPAWSIPPWPLFGTLAVMTLAVSAAALGSRKPPLHAAGAIAAGLTIMEWSNVAGGPWGVTAIVAAAVASAFAIGWLSVRRDRISAGAAIAVVFLAEFTAISVVSTPGPAPFEAIVLAHVVNLSVILALAWRHQWRHVVMGAVAVGGIALMAQFGDMNAGEGWRHLLGVAAAIYLVFIAYPIVLGRRARNEREPYVAAVAASAVFFFAARASLEAGHYGWMIGALPVTQGAILAYLLWQLLQMEPAGQRDLGRLALVAGATLAFVTVAIPLQLERQWITIGWALESAALAWLFVKVPHQGLLNTVLALAAAVFVRLAVNPEILRYEPRGAYRIFNWYLYAYLICAAAFLFAAWKLSRSPATIPGTSLRPTQVLPGAAVIMLFILLNIEIADFYATGATIMFRFGATLSQDLTYTIGWLAFGMLLLAACIYLHNRFGRVAALALIAITTFKCFLYDLGSLEGLYRVGSFVGLALSLAVVSLALQKFVLARPEEQA